MAVRLSLLAQFLSWLSPVFALPTQEGIMIQDGNTRKLSIQVQAHRGGIGYRTEESLYAFAHAIELGVDTLEMDTLFTSDGVPVIWHDHAIEPTKCRGPYVGQFIANLTLAQVKELDCGLQLGGFPQAQTFPNTRIATLEEVLELVKCYGDEQITINLETKIDPTFPNQTFPVENYITDIWPLIQKHGFQTRTTIQSFDWRTLIGIKRSFPEAATIALSDPSKTAPATDGSYPWLGGLTLADFGGDIVAAAASLNVSAFSPLHGFPTEATQFTPGYREFSSRTMANRAHALGLQLVPYTIDAEALMRKLIEDGVDGIISNYPQRVFWVAREMGFVAGKGRKEARPECVAKA